MLNPFEGMFFEKGPKRQGMEDLFGGGGGGYFTGLSGASYLGSSVGSYEGEKDGGYMGTRESNKPTEKSEASTGFNGTSGNKVYAKESGDSIHESKQTPTESRSPPQGGFHGNKGVSPYQGDEQKQPRSTPSAPLDFGNRYSANRNRDYNDYNKGQNNKNTSWGEPTKTYNANNQQREDSNTDRYRNDNSFGRGYNNRSNRFQSARDKEYPPPQADSNGSREMSPRYMQPPPTVSPSNGFPTGPPNLSMPPPPLMSSNHFEMSLRPQQSTNTMQFKPKTPSMLPKSAISRTNDGSSPLGENSLLGPSHPPLHYKVMQQKEPTILIKQGSLDAKGRKEKKAVSRGPTREEVFTKVDAIFADYLTNQNVNETVEQWKEKDWLPSKMVQTAAGHFFKSLLEKSETDKALAYTLLEALMKDGALNKVHCYEAIAKIVSTSNLEAPGRSGLADIAAWSVTEKIYTLTELSNLFQGGQWHPVFLEILQQLCKKSGKEHLLDMFDSVTIRLMDQLPEPDRTDEKLVQVLENFQLTFLMPLLSIQQDMSKQLASDGSPAAFSKWITDNVDASFHSQSGFILALFDVVFKFIIHQVTRVADNFFLLRKQLVNTRT